MKEKYIELRECYNSRESIIREVSYDFPERLLLRLKSERWVVHPIIGVRDWRGAYIGSHYSQ